MMLYVVLQEALYGCLRSVLLFYLKLLANLAVIGFRPTPYDSRLLHAQKMTITFHVVHLKILHHDTKQVDSIIQWFKSIYAGNVRLSPGMTHKYLGMILSYSNNQLQIWWRIMIEFGLVLKLRILWIWNNPVIGQEILKLVCKWKYQHWFYQINRMCRFSLASFTPTVSHEQYRWTMRPTWPQVSMFKLHFSVTDRPTFSRQCLLKNSIFC